MWVHSWRFKFQCKFQVPSNSQRFEPKLQANSYRTANSPIKYTMNRFHAKKQIEIAIPNSAETIHNWNTESRTISTIIWYSGFTITIRNVIVLITLHKIVQIIQESCTHTHNMQIVHLVYDHHVLTITCKSFI